MIAVAEGVEVPTVEAEKWEALCECWHFFEIEREHEDAVVEMMLLRLKPVVHHGALVEAGVHDQMGSPVTSRAHSSALVKPSSWKPYLNQAPA